MPIIPIQITQLEPLTASFAVEAEEMLFDMPATDLANWSVMIDSDNFNVDLYDLINMAPA
jgi:hypothetical protein